MKSRKFTTIGYLLFLLVMILPASAFTQGFVAPLENFATINNRPCYVIKTDGTKIEGTSSLDGIIIAFGSLKKVNVKDEHGAKKKFKASDLTEFAVKLGTYAKLGMITENVTTVETLTTTNFDDIIDREWIIFERRKRPNRKGQDELMQLLNKGFNSKISVYVNPMGNKTGGWTLNDLPLTGGNTTSYLIVRAGEDKAMVVSKRKYKKQFFEIFKDCQELIIAYPEKEVKWRDFAAHVFIYDQMK